MHPEALTQNTKSVLEAIGRSGLAKDFYLAGGTALALYFGHRLSIHLDWFSEKFDYDSAFRQKLEAIGRLKVNNESEKTFNGVLNGVKVSFFEYPYPLISPLADSQESIKIAGLPDIAAMKMEAIGSRGSRKDFVDIYFLLEKYSLKEIFSFVRQKFDQIDYNEAHLLKALTYFQEAEGGPEPDMIVSISWAEVKKAIESKARDYLND